MSMIAEDVNTAVDSSTTAAGEGDASQNAMAPSLGAETVKAEDVKDKAEPTMADAILDAVKQHDATVDKSTTGDKAEKALGSETELDAEGKPITEKGEDSGENEDAKVEDEKKNESEDKGPVPYERFQEVVHARQAVEQQLTETKPMVENYGKITSFCEQSNITPEQFHAALEVQALLNTNPTEALKRLMPLVEQLKGISGESLPTDLQKAVDDGDMPLEYAKRLARAEAQKQLSEQGSQMQQRRQQAEMQQQFRQTLATAAQSWEQQKRTSDPDYAPKTGVNDADGKWEMCRHVFTAMLHATDVQGNLLNPVRQPQDMTMLMERAYKQVSDSFTRLTAKPVIKKPLSSNGSSKRINKTVEGAGSMAEAIRIGISQIK